MNVDNFVETVYKCAFSGLFDKLRQNYACPEFMIPVRIITII